MPASIGVNLRVTGHCSQGGRKYMEDLFSVAYQQTEDERDLEYAFFGIYDGHGGSEAAAFAKEHLMDSIVKQRQFWSDNDEDVLKAIRNGYMLTHLNMWKELEKWPKTVTGLPSTAGTTASVAFIRRGKIYVGHVGDSAIVLGYQKDGSEEWGSKPLTLDHKPESSIEMERIQRCGGKVVSKAGVPRVVWNRPRAGHKGPIKKNTPMDEIPFLAVARSLGDLWSYNTNNDEFIVSPDPDVGVLTIDPTKFRCLIFGTDGLWNMISPEGAVTLVQATERHNEAALVAGSGGQPRDWLNPSKSLVDHALERWSNTRMRADNTSVVTLMLDPPGPPRATVLRARGVVRPPAPPPEPRALPVSGLTIMTRYSDAERPDRPDRPAPLPPVATLDARFSTGPQPDAPADEDPTGDITNYGNPAESYFMARLLNRTNIVNTLSDVFDEIVKSEDNPVCARDASPPPALTVVPDEEPAPAEKGQAEEPAPPADGDDVDIQINEVSSSSPAEGPRARARRPRPEPLTARVLRSQDQPPRPATRQTGRRAEPEPMPPAPVAPCPADAPPASLERVVILSRARTGAGRGAETVSGRCTRSRDAAATDARATRDVPASGNSTRGSGATRRGPAAARARRAPPALDCSKENCAATRRRRADPAPSPPRTRLRDSRREDDVEVHSTTAEVRPRALRSRNEPAAPPPPGKRPRVDDSRAGKGPPPAPSAGKAARPEAGGVKAARPEGGAPKPARPEVGPAKPSRLERRAGLAWSSALSLRNRLRKRLVK